MTTHPDTTKVTFGARHEGTGMVLLQHADLPGLWWGEEHGETATYHRALAAGQVRAVESAVIRAAHAAFAEVREHLDTAEADGVTVSATDGRAYCLRMAPAGGDFPLATLRLRTGSLLAREVQALVDQGLRGDALNAAVPFEVRDHREPEVTAADRAADMHEGGGTSTPRGVTTAEAPVPVAGDTTPAVDDDLLRDLGLMLHSGAPRSGMTDERDGRLYRVPSDRVTQWLDSEPMRCLRAVWEAPLRAELAEAEQGHQDAALVNRRLAAELAEVTRQSEELRAHLREVATHDFMQRDEAIAALIEERDVAERELAEVTRQRDAWKEAAKANARQRDEAMARPALPEGLPDVGEVSWHRGGTLAIDMGHGNDWFWRPEMIDGHELSALRELAAVRAARAFVAAGAEERAARDTTDDEVEVPGAFDIHLGYQRMCDEVDRLTSELMSLRAHRARTSGEAGR